MSVGVPCGLRGSPGALTDRGVSERNEDVLGSSNGTSISNWSVEDGNGLWIMGMSCGRPVTCSWAVSLGAPDAVRARRGCLATSIGNALCRRLDSVLSRRAPPADVFVWDGEGPQWAKGRFKDFEVGANCTLLLIVLCLRKERRLCNFCGQSVCSPQEPFL